MLGNLNRQTRSSQRTLLQLPAIGRKALLWIGLLFVLAAMALTLPNIGNPLRAASPTPLRLSNQPADVVESKVLFICNDVPVPEICVQHLPTRRITQLTDDGNNDRITGLSWSPDGGQVVFAAKMSDAPRMALYLIGADGSHERLLGEAGAEGGLPTWLANGPEDETIGVV